MVGNEARYRNYCRLMPQLCSASECRSFGKEGISVFECRHWALASQSFAAYARAKNQTSAEAYAEARFYDAERGGQIPMGCPKDAPFGEVLPDRLVHGEQAKRNNRP